MLASTAFLPLAFDGGENLREFVGKYLLFGNEQAVVHFKYGYVVGTIVCLVLFLVVKLLFMIFFEGGKKAKGINIAGNNGNLFISADAIADLIKTLEGNYRHLDITRVSLHDRSKFYALEIQMNYDLDGGELPTMATEFQTLALSKLNSVFGIDCVKEVNLSVKRASKSRNTRF